jgi:hypothetical protein
VLHILEAKKLNIVFAALVCLMLCTITGVTWYFAQPLCYSVINTCLNFLHGQGLLNADQTLGFSKYLTILWGPVLIAFYILWFLIFGTREDTGSVTYTKR